MSTENNKNFFSNVVGVRLKTLRTSMGLSQKAFAKKVGCAEITIRSIENGKRGVSVDMLCRIAQALDMKWAEFDPMEGGE